MSKGAKIFPDASQGTNITMQNNDTITTGKSQSLTPE
jgi:hypothetical protein